MLARLILLLLAFPAWADQTVTVNDWVTSCATNPTMVVDTSGNIAITCTANQVPVPPTPIPPTQGCTTTTSKSLTGTYSTDTPTVSKTGYVSYKLPIYTSANIPTQIINGHSYPGTLLMNFTGVNNNADGQTNPKWGVQFTIGTCPGDFVGLPNCTRWGVPDNGGIQLPAYPQAALATAGNNCTTAFGAQYYLNVRFVNNDLKTPSCQNSTCTLIVNFNSSAKL